MQQTPVDNDSEKKSTSASPAEIAKKAAEQIFHPFSHENKLSNIETITSAIKEAVQPLKMELKDMFKRDREYGCGFDQDEKWHKHYMELARHSRL